MVLDNPTTFEAWSSRLRKKPYFPNNPQQHRRSRAHKTMSQNKQCPKTMSQNNVAQNNVDQERTKQCPFHTLKSVPHLMWQNTLCDLYVTLCDLYVTFMWPLCDLYVTFMWPLCDLMWQNMSVPHLEVRVGYKLEDEAGRFWARVLHYVHQIDDVRSATHVLCVYVCVFVCVCSCVCACMCVCVHVRARDVCMHLWVNLHVQYAICEFDVR